LVRLIHLAGRLKLLERQGWIDRGVREPESVADHSYRLALMAVVCGSTRPDVDAARAAILAIVHDLPEALAGDRTPFDDKLSDAAVDRAALFRQVPEYDQQADRRKSAAEQSAMQELTRELPARVARLLLDAWEEYEAGESPEARFVRQLDKLETWLQAREYRAEQPELVIESFRLGTRRDVTDPELVQLLEGINELFSSRED
jgi:putative hydrolases of HD superfamily